MTKEAQKVFEALLQACKPAMEKDEAVFTINSHTQKDPVVFRQKVTKAEIQKWRLA